MKKSEFKKLVKECVRECLSEIMQEQSERRSSKQTLINPMDDTDLVQRNKILQRQLLERQSKRDERPALPQANEYHTFDSPMDRLRFAQQANSVRFDPTLDAPIGKRSAVQPQAHQAPADNSNVSFNPDVMKNIFADTMQTTYKEQAAVGHTMPSRLGDDSELIDVPADRFAAQVARSKPDELFEGAQNWAMLAFK